MNEPVLGLALWIWILIVVVVIVIIIIAVVVGRGRGEVRNRERAAELRDRASQDEQHLTSRQQRAEELEGQADTARQRAMAESEKADALRVQAGESDELASRASEKAEMLDDEAAHSREAFREATEEHEKTLREADRRDPDVHTDRHGNRIDDTAAADDVDAVRDDGLPDDRNERSADVMVFDDEHRDPTAASDRDSDVIPENERLDVGDDYSRDEFAEPDADYIDPTEHDRLAHQDEPVVPATDTYHDEPATTQGRRMESSPSERTPEAEGEPIRDPYGNPVAKDTSARSGATALDDDVSRDDQGRRLDPYGNPVAEEQSDSFTASDDSLDDDVPRDDRGRRLDPYGNPVPEEPTASKDVMDDDVPRDEHGRRLDPYGNPVAEDRNQ